jgi:hypothetical protein
MHLRLLIPILFSSLVVAGAACGKEPGWRPSFSITPVYQGSGDLDGGGNYSVGSVFLRAGLTRDLGRGNRAGVVFNYDYSDYSFSNPLSFGGVAPWGSVKRYGMSAPLSFMLDDGWSAGVTPSIDWFGERDADTSESLTWGAIFTAIKRFDNGNRLGLGFGAFDRIEETRIFPFLLVDWRLSERWRLVNPLQAGPTGPAGLELDYRLDSGWNMGLGAAWRSNRFRLDKTGSVANGIGEERSTPVFLRATRNWGDSMALNIYAGIVTNGRLRVEDASGNGLREVNTGSAPLFGATFSIRH